MKMRSLVANLLLLGNVLGNMACSTLPNEVHNQNQVATEDSEWKIVPGDGGDTILAQRKTDGELVFVECEPDACSTLVMTDGACDINSTIPILVNTAVESGIAQGQCFPVDDPNAAAWAASLIVLNEPNLLLPYMILGDNVNLAVPMSDGEIRVYLIPMDSLRELIAPLRPDLFESPGWLNEHELEPLPDEEAMDDEEMILWRRGLLAI